MCVLSIKVLIRKSGNLFNDIYIYNSRLSRTKNSEMVLDAFFLNTQYYKVWIKGKCSKPGKAVAPSPTPRCSYCHFLYGQSTNYIYIHIYMEREGWIFKSWLVSWLIG